LIAVKIEEYNTMEDKKAETETEKAEAEQVLANTQQVYDDTAAQKAADIEFFDATRKACSAKHEEWTERSDLREEELAGINEALEILTSDAARELFAKAIQPGAMPPRENFDASKYKEMKDRHTTIKNISELRGGYKHEFEVSSSATSFLQLDSADIAVGKAFGLLQNSARKTHSLRLGMLALQVHSAKVGHFDKVIYMINRMIALLNTEAKDDQDKLDQCKALYAKHTMSMMKYNWSYTRCRTGLERLLRVIEETRAELARVEKRIVEVNEFIAMIKQQRLADNTAFLRAKRDDEDSIAVLEQAKNALSKFYTKNDLEMGPLQGAAKAVFAQQEPEFAVSADQAPDAELSHKGSRKMQSKGILTVLQSIIDELNDEIKYATQAEEQAQLHFEEQLAAAEKLLAELVAKKIALEQAIASYLQERTRFEETCEHWKGQIGDEVDHYDDIRPDCDWIIGAFKGRADARTAEMEGLIGAKDYLAGAQSASTEATLLEMRKGSTFDDNVLSNVDFVGLRQ
jgi:hypothetical protein